MSEEKQPAKDPATEENGNEQAEEDPEVVVLTLDEAMEVQDVIMRQSAAVLGASSDKHCSYPEGYIKRQALYSCLTCIPESKTDVDKSAGVCLACTYHCHDGHDLVELYTKRNFRCDCGNTKFQTKCNLSADKDELNQMNTYNQNFSGLYCVCRRPYPDSEDDEDDEMIQCILCEDWFHTRHLGVEMPNENFAEMICESCIKEHQFLLHYQQHCTGTKLSKEDQEGDVEVEESKEEKGCKKPKDKSDQVSTKFYRDIGWRKSLCACDECLKVYEAEDVTFLLDADDPVHLYEEKAEVKANKAMEDQEKKLLNTLPRAAVLDTISKYNELKQGLAVFFEKFAKAKRVVKEEDVREFFDELKNKRQRTE